MQVLLNLSACVDLVLLSVPRAHLTTTYPSPALLDGTFSIEVSLCNPTSITHYVNTGQCIKPVHHDASKHRGAHSSGCSVGANVVADSVVVWVESNWGDGGWLSTGPTRTPYAQQVLHFLPKSINLASAQCTLIEACYKGGVMVGIGVQSTNV